MPSFGKTNPLKKVILPILLKLIQQKIELKYKNERFSVFTKRANRQKRHSLDLGLIKDDSILDYETCQILLIAQKK